jgi:hypothetical protein
MNFYMNSLMFENLAYTMLPKHFIRQYIENFKDIKGKVSKSKNEWIKISLVVISIKTGMALQNLLLLVVAHPVYHNTPAA